jgi:hypothetical protein
VSWCAPHYAYWSANGVGAAAAAGAPQHAPCLGGIESNCRPRACALIRVKLPLRLSATLAKKGAEHASTLSVVAIAAAVALSAGAWAQQPPPDQDHAAHHPEGASAPAGSAKMPPAKLKAPAAKSKSPAAAASTGMGMDGGMGKMHEEAHKPGGMHDQMHGKDGKMMGSGAMSAKPAASAASK